MTLQRRHQDPWETRIPSFERSISQPREFPPRITSISTEIQRQPFSRSRSVCPIRPTPTDVYRHRLTSAAAPSLPFSTLAPPPPPQFSLPRPQNSRIPQPKINPSTPYLSIPFIPS